MKLKLDENIPLSVSRIVSDGGHDVESVQQERLQGAHDDRIAAVCRAEDRALLTLDLDFANIGAYPPADYPGIIVLRPRNQSAEVVVMLVRQFLNATVEEDPRGALWIVEPGRIRISKGGE